MKPSLKGLVLTALAAGLFGASLGLKVLASPALGLQAAKPVPRIETLRRFLTAETARPVSDVGGGWRLADQTCPMMAFPSGGRGELDFDAQRHAHRGDRVAYVYRGRVLAAPPKLDLARDLAGYYLTRAFRPVNEPGYVVLVIPKGCAAPPRLAWERLPA